MAVLAASGASFAQSSVTLYGLLDIWGGVSKAQDPAAALLNAKTTSTLSTNAIGSGGVDTNRFGFKGSEDLGGGLKAEFQLEQGFSIDTGAAGTIGAKSSSLNIYGVNNTTPVNAAFNRQAWVGFSGGFGQVKLGKTGTAYDDATGSGNAVFNSALSAEANTWVSNSSAYNWNPANGIVYVSPTISGFSGEVSYALGENKTSSVGAGSITAFSAAYAGGPLTAAFGYQEEKATGSTDALKFTALSGTYDLGVAKLKAGYGKVAQAATPTTSEYEFGVDYPVSAALTLSANYAQSKDEAPVGGAETKRTGLGMGGAYSLSKRTFVYGGYRSETSDQAGAGDLKTSLFAVGVHHTF